MRAMIGVFLLGVAVTIAILLVAMAIRGGKNKKGGGDNE